MSFDGVRFFRNTYLPADASAAPAAKAPSFEDNPRGAIANWKKMIDEDVQEGKSIDEYRVVKEFDRMAHEQRKEILLYLCNNYALPKEKNIYALKFPPGKIALANAKDSLERKLENSGVEKVSSQELFVLLFSAGGIKNDEETDVYFAATEYQECVFIEQLPEIQPVLIMGEGENRVSFYYEKGIDVASPEVRDKIEKMYDLVAKANEVTPGHPITVVRLSQNGEAHYCSLDGYVDVPLSGENYLGTLAHEVGHQAFKHKIASGKELKQWERIYKLSLRNQMFELFDDSNYSGENDHYGHPQSDPSELFASAFAAYLVAPDILAANISDPDTGETGHNFGIIVYCFLRDQVFNGNVFCAKDPFSDIDTEKQDLLFRKESGRTYQPASSNVFKETVYKKHATTISAIHPR